MVQKWKWAPPVAPQRMYHSNIFQIPKVLSTCDQQVTLTWLSVWEQVQLQGQALGQVQERVSLNHKDWGTCSKTGTLHDIIKSNMTKNMILRAHKKTSYKDYLQVFNSLYKSFDSSDHPPYPHLSRKWISEFHGISIFVILSKKLNSLSHILW